jgi:hypothetical protein
MSDLDALHSEIFEELREIKKFPCMGTCRNYIYQWQNEGNILAKLHTGNQFAQLEIHGDDLFHLVLYQIAPPKAIGAEVWAFIYNCNPNLKNQLSPFQLCRAEKRLGLTMKVGSTSVEHANVGQNVTPHNPSLGLFLYHFLHTISL